MFSIASIRKRLMGNKSSGKARAFLEEKFDELNNRVAALTNEVITLRQTVGIFTIESAEPKAASNRHFVEGELMTAKEYLDARKIKTVSSMSLSYQAKKILTAAGMPIQRRTILPKSEGYSPSYVNVYPVSVMDKAYSNITNRS